MKAFVQSFGCQLNVSDGEKLKGLLGDMGYSFTGDNTEADLIILNTCAVRESAEERVFGIIGEMKHLKEAKPEMIIIVSGCMTAQEHIAPKIKKSYPHVDIVVGTGAFASLPKLIEECRKGQKFGVDISEYDDFSHERKQVRESTFKASVPIMFGCNNFCTYCIVPYVRGRERSRNAEDIVSEVRGLVENGYKEIMLLGQNVNSYGKDLDGSPTFPQLLRLLDGIDGDFVIRFMSSHPKDVTNELIEAIFDCKKVAKHLHLPIQSGNDDILKAMNRNYTVRQYLDTVNKLRSQCSDFSLTTDIIVGFPNETDRQFEDTVSLLRKVKFDNIFAFIYSKRTGTKAAEIDDKISGEVKSQRMQSLLEVQREIAEQNNKRFIGRTLRVLADTVSKKRKGRITGKSDEFIIVEFDGDSGLLGEFVDVKVDAAMNWAVSGKMKEEGIENGFN